MLIKIITFFIALILSGFSILSAAKAASKQKLHFLTTDYCPLVCDDKDVEGIMIDILREIYAPSKFDIKITFLPIKRAFKEFSLQNYDGFIGGNKIQLNKNIFPKYVTVPNPTYFYKLKDSKWKYNGFKSLEGILIASVGGFIYPNKKIMDYLKTKNKSILILENDKHLEKMLALLKSNRITAFIAGELASEYHFKKSSIKRFFMTDPKTVGTFHNFISINPVSKKSKKNLELLNRKFKEIFNNGKLQKIYKKYGINRKLNLTKG